MGSVLESSIVDLTCIHPLEKSVLKTRTRVHGLGLSGSSDLVGGLSWILDSGWKSC